MQRSNGGSSLIDCWISRHRARYEGSWRTRKSALLNVPPRDLARLHDFSGSQASAAARVLRLIGSNRDQHHRDTG